MINKLLGGASATVHFHGFTFNDGFSWYDGVAGITQVHVKIWKLEAIVWPRAIDQLGLTHGDQRSSHFSPKLRDVFTVIIK